MTMMDLVLIRHAPTPWNRAKRLQGRSNIALDAAGRAVAISWRDAASVWANWQIVASPLLRAKETAALLFPGRPVSLEPRLAEMNFGDWEGKTLRDLRAEPGGEAARRELLGLDFHAPGGESPRQVQQRLRPLLLELAGRNQATVAVAHKAVLRALYALAIDWDMTVKPPEKIHANSAHHFQVDDHGQPHLMRLNISLLPAPVSGDAIADQSDGTDQDRR